MFVLCPHCDFLVGVDPRTGKPPASCPRCGQALEAQAPVEEAPPAPPVVVVDAAPQTRAAVPEPGPTPEPAPEPTPAPAQKPESPAPHLRADDMIAAISAKAPRRPRAKPRAETPAAPKPAPREPTRRKRVEVEAPATPTAPPAKPAPAPPISAAPGPSIAQRFANWFKSRKPETPSAPASDAPRAPGPARPKASVRPVPSLRERAEKRAAAAKAAAEATTTPAPIPEIEALSIAEMPPLPPVADSVAAVAVAPVETLANKPPAVAAPAIEAPAIEAPAVDARAVEAPAVDVPAVDAPAGDAPKIAASAIAAPVAAARAPAPPSNDTPPPARAPAPTPVAAHPTMQPVPRARTAAPSFARNRATPSNGAMPAQWPRVAAIAGLALLLALQLLLAQRDALAADARWRPTVAALCTFLRCSVAPWREPDAFTMLSRDVRPHPSAPGTLQIDASFRNDARWPQPWPRLLVSLSDIDGRVVGTRAFTAREYLGAAPTQNALASGQTAAVRLAVVEPAPGIVAFSFEFR